MLKRTGSLREEQYPSMTEVSTRRHTFSTENRSSMVKKIKEISPTSQSLNRSEPLSDLHRFDQHAALSYSAKLDYDHTATASELNAKDYVYCGMVTALPVNNLGMSVDNEGNLILIKGDGHDLFKGLIKKYTSGYAYKATQITDGACSIRVDSLYVNENGLLICDEKETGKSYVINISIPSSSGSAKGQSVIINFIEYDKNHETDLLAFKIDADTVISYFYNDNKLYLKSIQQGDKSTDYSVMNYEISIPLKEDCKIISVKRAKKCLQIETEKKNKKRIFYLDPKHISHKKFSAKKISHKPPQLFSARFGGDPHERYHAGQPFTSDRKENFSSKHIPLFSSTVDDFRINTKLSKVSIAEGNTKDAIFQISKAFDPCINGISSTVSGLAKIKQEIRRNDIKKKNDLYDSNMKLLRLHSQHLATLVHDIWGLESVSNISEILSNLIKEIKPREAIHFTSSNRISAFFGIASGGVPFVRGWFVGIILEFSDRHDLTISRSDEDNIRLVFRNRYKAGITALAGTGQGLEKTLLHARRVDYLTVLPVEANLIMTFQCVWGDDFSFEMSEENFKNFVTQLTERKRDAELEKLIISEAEAKKIKEKEFVIKLEAKSELRLEAGTMANPGTYMVMPRTAIGARLALDLLNIKSTSESTAMNDDAFSVSSEKFKITALKPEADLFAEWKIMPIVMHPGEADQLWCFPLPLQEEARPFVSPDLRQGLTLLDRATPVVESIQPEKNQLTATSIHGVKKTPVLIAVDEKGKVKKRLTSKNKGMKLKNLDLVNETISHLKHTLANQEVSSQYKACAMHVVSRYERIDDQSSVAERMAMSSAESTDVPRHDQLTLPASGSTSSEITFYRLKKMEFRKLSSSSDVNATTPLSILRFSNINDVTYDQYLGEIDFLYNESTDTVPFDVERKLAVLY